jgi:hypothetical protein
MKLKLVLPWVCVAALLAGLGALYSSNQKQEAELAQLRQDSQELQKLRAAAEETSKTQAQTDPEELTRLRKDHEDVLRLRNEVRQLRDDKQQLARQTQAVTPTPANPQQQQQMQQLMAENQQLRAQTQQIQVTNQAAVCINNLRQLEGAKEQWALENQKPPGALVNPQDLQPYLQNKAIPTCPAGGAYTLNPIGIPPLCNIPGHVVPRQ